MIFLDSMSSLALPVAVCGLTGIILAITEPKRPQAKLAKERALLRCLIDAVSDLIFIKDRDGVYRGCNKASETFIGMPESEQIGKTDFDFFDRQKAEQIRKVDRQVLEQGRPLRIKEWVTCRDGRRLLMDTLKAPYYGPDGEALGLVGIGRDITELNRNNAINKVRWHMMQFAVTHSLDELLEETLNEAEKLTDSCIGFYHFVEDDQKTLALQNWSTGTKARFCRAEGKGLHYAFSEAAVWVDCVYQRKPVIHNDYAAFARHKGMPKGHAEVVRVLVVPVLRGAKIKAILGIGNKPTDYTQNDVEAISLLADLAWEIAERKQLDTALRESEARYRIVADNTYDWELWVDTHGQILYCSPSCQRITGHTAEAFTRRADLLNHIIHDQDRDRFIRHQQQVEANRQQGEIEFRILQSDGSVRHIGHVCQPVFGVEGQYLGIRSSNRDITDRKSAEAELARHRDHLEDLVAARTRQLRQSEEHYRRLFETMLQGVVYQDVEGKITSLNAAAERILGVPQSELEGQTSVDREPYAIHADGSQFPGIEHPAMVALHSGKEVRDVVMGVYNPREQGYRWININAMPMVRAGEDRPYQVYIIFDDITERRQVEAEIAQLNRNLQERADALEAANKELEAFAYTISHDLRAPLRHIDGFVGLLEKGAAALDEQSRHCLDNISQAALRMADLIEDLLAFSRVGRNQMARRPVDLTELTREVIHEFEPETGNRNVDWDIGDLPVVTADRAMLRMVLVNLVSNALKFTRPRRQARIEIGSMPGPASEAVIFVRDNGVGFSMTYVDKLFGVFQRLHRAEEFEGTGIGLASVHRIITRHGGRTWAEGKPDQGAAFYFALPRALEGDGRWPL
jgi:PAS domain S-box-containing protein